MRRTVALCAAGLLLVGGCSSGGTAQPSQTGTKWTRPSTTPELPPLELAERPRTLRADGVDPCLLLPEASRAELEIDQPPLRTDDGKVEPIFLAPLCSFSVNAWGAYGVVATDKFGAQDYLDRSPNPSPQIKAVDVAGFPTVVFQTNSGICVVVVDIGDESSIMVNSQDRREDLESRKNACVNAVKAAGVAVTTLESLQQQ